ncbi:MULTISPECIES: NAD-dependent deacylase [Microbacterium]|uniref:NAD-dependent deacylase n=1 Tax=Microbacterium TaxID=33882 RepID=UPI00214ACE1A|nr:MULTISPECIES: NAD-dependent deacylase [unclassified Microbacterium]MCR2812663.1 NAD-dependent deacylase [Microbacterium sp. zg.Y1084]MDL5485816.1 NAD-dependent deacylase [Microbacterium sp. zg-Y1211]
MTARIVVLTGAGISAESGLATFRAADGLWEEHRIEDVATPEGFARNPALVHAFYDQRRRAARAAEPNAAHRALADLERGLDGEVLIVTQNVDDLHERAGSRNVIHIHGQLDSALCTTCGQRMPWADDLADEPPCPACGHRTLRPDVVWFGEQVHHLDEIYDAVGQCEEFWVIGTSGNVSPASTLHALAGVVGAKTALLNLETHEDTSLFDEVVLGPASVVVPAYVQRRLSGERPA